MSLKLGLGLGLHGGASDAFADYVVNGEYPSIIMDRSAGLFGIGDGGASAPTAVSESGFFASGSIGALTAAANAKAASLRTCVCHFTAPATIGTEYIWVVSDGSFKDLWRYITISPSSTYSASDNFAAQASVTTGTVATSTAHKFAGRMATNDFRGCFNGTLTAADTVITVPDEQNRIDIGERWDSTSPFLGTIEYIAFYTGVFNDATLQALTT